MSSLFWRENAHGEEYDLYPGSRRRSVPYAQSQNRSSVNLFGGTTTATATATARGRDENAENDGVCEISQPISRHWTRDNNRESKSTQEFPPSGIRMVKPASHVEKPQGLRMVPCAAGNEQHVQVVNITRAYRDPANMPSTRPCVQFDPTRNCSKDVRYALAYANTASQLHGDAAASPVGKAKRTTRFTIDYTAQQRFHQAVRNHAHQRAGSVGSFYVSLMRGLVAPATASTPSPTRKTWSLDEPAQGAAPLTLGRCHDQLVALTRIDVSLFALADLLWDMDAYSACSDGWTDEDLATLPVSYPDFAGAFADSCPREATATMKL